MSKKLDQCHHPLSLRVRKWLAILLGGGGISPLPLHETLLKYSFTAILAYIFQGAIYVGR